MKLEEAIEILTEMSGGAYTVGADDDARALQIGIEALKRYKVLRANFGKLKGDQLPGETED